MDCLGKFAYFPVSCSERYYSGFVLFLNSIRKVIAYDVLNMFLLYLLVNFSRIRNELEVCVIPIFSF